MVQPNPSSPTTAVIDDERLITGEAVAIELRPASVMLRAAGTVIDAVAYLLLLGVAAWIVVQASGPSLDQALARALGVAGLVLFLLIVPMTVEAASGGRSLGKLAIGARIVRDDGGAIQLRHAFVRALMGVLEIYLTLGGIAAMVGLLNERSKRLGDILAGTHSQLERVARYRPADYGVPPGLGQWAVTADVARLPDRLGRRVAQFLSQADALMPATRSRLAGELAAEVAPYVSPLPPVPAEVFLVAVSALRRNREFTGLALEQQRLAALDPVLTGLPHGFPER